MKTWFHRKKAVNNKIETHGVKVMEKYSILGPYNFFNIVGVSDNNAIYRVSEELRNPGIVGLMNIQTMATDDLIKTLKEETPFSLARIFVGDESKNK